MYHYRQRDFSIEQPETMDELENYAEQGHSSILYLILESLGVKDEASEYACSHVGVSSGIVTTLRAFPYHAKQVSTYKPTRRYICDYYSLYFPSNLIIVSNIPATRDDAKARLATKYCIKGTQHRS
jgi:hypothetical protein